MTYSVRFTEHAEADLVRLYQFVLSKDETDWQVAESALETIRQAVRSLEIFPFSYRKASTDNPFLRELIIPFGSSGYVALFEIEDSETVTILALRYQREDDYR
jgi:plasmid stabilization system protein ParE